MTNLVQTLRSIKPALEQKKIIRPKTWSLYSSFNKVDPEQLATKLASIGMFDTKKMEQDKEVIGREINSYTDALRKSKKKMADIESKIEYAKDSKSVEKKRKEIDRIMSNLLIQHYEFVEPAVTIFTTEFLKKGNRVMGVYRIWIDWSKQNPHEALKILNVYKRAGDYDHPCVNDGRLCMGNSEPVLTQNLKEKNIFALLETLISFIVSENVSHGYIHSWEDWEQQAQKLTKELTFADRRITPGTVVNGMDVRTVMREVESQLHSQSRPAVTQTFEEIMAEAVPF